MKSIADFLFNIRLFFAKVIARILGREFVRVGRCNQCGSCCQRVSLFVDGRQLKTLKEFEEVCQVFPEYRRFYVVDDSDPEELLFTCGFLGEGNICRDYRNRPLICRRYPSPGILKKGGYLMPGCGYRFVEVRGFRTILERAIDAGPLLDNEACDGEEWSDEDAGGRKSESAPG